MARYGILATIVVTTRVVTAIALTACDNLQQPGQPGGPRVGPEFARSNSSSAIKIAALPTLGGSAGANGINASGTFIVGSSADASGLSHPVRWKVANSAWQLETLADDGRGGGASAVNAVGAAVGSVNGLGLFFWRTDGAPTLLGCPADPAGQSIVEGINAQEMIVGMRDVSSTSPVAVVWTKDEMSGQWCRHDLPPLLNGGSTDARAIADDGTIAGHAYDAEGKEWAVRWTYANGAWGSAQRLDDIGEEGAWAISAGTSAFIVGSGRSIVAPSTSHAMFWPGRTDLGTLGGYSWARGVNAQREIAGESTAHAGVHAFFVAAPGAPMQDLGVLRGNGESHALGISDVQTNGTRFVVGASVTSGTRRSSSAVVWTVGP